MSAALICIMLHEHSIESNIAQQGGQGEARPRGPADGVHPGQGGRVPPEAAAVEQGGFRLDRRGVGFALFVSVCMLVCLADLFFMSEEMMCRDVVM